MFFLLTWFPVVAWASLIFYLSSIPSLSTGWGLWDFLFRKLAHMVEYAVLTWLLIRAWRRTHAALTGTGVMVLSATMALLYAMSDEFHQSFVPGRGPSVLDILIDGCGIVGALALVNLKRVWVREK